MPPTGSRDPAKGSRPSLNPTPHVCFLTSSAPLGPGDAYSPFILDLAEAITRRGFRVTILTPHVRGSETRELLRGVPIRRYRYLPDPHAETLGMGGGMLPGLRERRFDLLKVPALLKGQHAALAQLHREDPLALIHSHWMIPQGVVAGWFAHGHGVPHVATVHGSDLLGLRFPGTRQALGYAVRRSRIVTVNSRAMREELVARVPEVRVRIVPIGTRAPQPGVVEGNLDLRRSLGTGHAVLGFVGRLVPEKGILDFIRVLANLRRLEEPVMGLVVGSGSARNSAASLAEGLGIREAVHFTGAVDPNEVFRYMSAMDVLLMPSHYEAQGLVAIEAMASGLPVVACRTGGLAEIVVEGETGYLAEVGDIEGLTRAAHRILSDPVLRREIALKAYQVVEDRFTLEAAAEQFHRAYEELRAEVTDP